MIRSRLLTAAVAVAMLVSVSSAAVAQEVAPDLEGTDWSLVTYYDEDAGEFEAVPFDVRPTLRLEEGAASGFGGCNDFSGSYELDDSRLAFSDELTVTLKFCEGPAQEVEDVYLAALGQIGGWSIDDARLGLYDDLGDLMLAFEVPSVTWTPTQLATLLGTLESLQTTIDTLRSDTDSLNVPNLRQRIKALEKANKTLTKRVTELEDAPKVDPEPDPTASTLSFSAAEKVLLKGIPTRIANYCMPLRSQLPRGTQAAVSCRPNTSVVASVDYFLLEGSRAVTAFGSVMEEFKVPEAGPNGTSCADGTKSQSLLIGNGWQAEGCYRENKKAQLLFVDNATDCKKLKVGGKTLSSPAFYMALQGSNQDIARVYTWATKGLAGSSGQMTSITQPIPSKLAASPACVG